MTSRLPALMRLWPQIDPRSVWDLPYDLWVTLAAAADDWIAERG